MKSPARSRRIKVEDKTSHVEDEEDTEEEVEVRSDKKFIDKSTSTTTHSSSAQASDKMLSSIAIKPQQALPASPRKLGTIGRARPVVTSPSSKNSTPSVENDAMVPQILATAHHEAIHSPSKPLSKLGRIGGQQRQSEHTSKSHITEQVSQDRVDKTPSPVKESMKPISNNTTLNVADREMKSPSPVASSQELANRKRDELKRQLEEKQKTQAKKKRKF